MPRGETCMEKPGVEKTNWGKDLAGKILGWKVWRWKIPNGEKTEDGIYRGGKLPRKDRGEKTGGKTLVGKERGGKELAPK